MLALSISAVDKSFRAGALGCSAHVRVLRGVGLAIWSGEMVALEGARSSGKTTVLRCAAGLLRPDTGNIRWFGAHVVPPNAVWYAGTGAPDARDARVHGALHARLESVLERGARLLLLDDLDAVGGLERRLILHLLAEHVARGTAVLVASRLGLDGESLVSRVVTLAEGAIVQRRKRSATRIAASSFASRARSSARSTYGRSFRSPQ